MVGLRPGGDVARPPSGRVVLRHRCAIARVLIRPIPNQDRLRAQLT